MNLPFFILIPSLEPCQLNEQIKFLTSRSLSCFAFRLADINVSVICFLLRIFIFLTQQLSDTPGDSGEKSNGCTLCTDVMHRRIQQDFEVNRILNLFLIFTFIILKIHLGRKRRVYLCILCFILFVIQIFNYFSFLFFFVIFNFTFLRSCFFGRACITSEYFWCKNAPPPSISEIQTARNFRKVKEVP